MDRFASEHDAHAAEQHIARLRHWRHRPERDLSLSFINEYVQKQIAKPAAQLGDLGSLWVELVPVHLLPRTQLAKFTRGVLHVTVPDAATNYELDRLLRSGLELTLKQKCKTTLRKIRVSVGAVDA
ncbi:MAG: DUF721 domain-containing protein [Planctomycetes bacterium]|nr:DUF721 domain-containing protein [Planctomycetota bacterium]